MQYVGPYRLDALVGRGRAGSVWRARRDGTVVQEVAVKRARAATGADGADRLRREAAILADLDHPHIVRVIDVLDDGDDVAIVMSLARGGSLHDLLAERGRLSAGETVAVLGRVADALDSAHRHGVFHGDVKPANILFTTDGEPVLGDFGVAQHLDPAAVGLGGVGGLRAVEGTTGYVDPELVATGRPEPRNDVYGLSVVAYLCLTGRLPHLGESARDVLAAAEAGGHPSLLHHPDVPPPLAALVEAGLARDPDRRPPTAGDVARAMRASVPAGAVVLPGVARVRGTPSDATDTGAQGPGVVPDGPDRRAATGGEGLDRLDDADDRDGLDASDGRRGTRAFGPRPDRPAESGGRRGRPLLTGLAVVSLLAGAAGAGLWIRHRLAEEQRPGEVTLDGATGPAGVECPSFEPIPVPEGATELEGDLTGDGCLHQVVWDGRVMRFWLDPTDPAARRYDFSEADGSPAAGQMLLGDWNCDGVDTPALYRPSNGVVAYFSEVPGRVSGTATATDDPTGVVDGRASVVRGGDGGCDTVEVEPEA